MENESLAMAMAKLAKTAKAIPPKIHFPAMTMAKVAKTAKSGPDLPDPKPVFSQFSQNSHSHSVEINFSARPHVAIAELPARLVNAAVRVCREIHQDTEEAVQAMLSDLTWSDPKDWAALIDHFEAQLPPAPRKPIPSMGTCSGCRHAEYRDHPAIAYCKVGVESGIPIGGWWATDEHLCDRRESSVRHEMT